MAKLVDIDRTAYGLRLHQARMHAQKMGRIKSQQDLADQAGMSQSNLSELERSGQGSAKTAKLAEICGVRAAWLESGVGPMLDTSEVSGEARTVASEKVAHYLVGTPASADYRTIALTLAAALEESGTELSVRQFVKLLEATYEKLRP